MSYPCALLDGLHDTRTLDEPFWNALTSLGGNVSGRFDHFMGTTTVCSVVVVIKYAYQAQCYSQHETVHVVLVYSGKHGQIIIALMPKYRDGTDACIAQ